jgi:hypothetical protein
MLIQLLELLAHSQVSTLSELARRLGAGEGLLVAMLEDAARRGLLTIVEGCATACDKCSVKSCAIAAQGRAFVLTDAGRALITRRA